VLLIDKLQFLQMGYKFSRIVSPPFDSGISCPQSKLNAVIMFVHHLTGHFLE